MTSRFTLTGFKRKGRDLLLSAAIMVVETLDEDLDDDAGAKAIAEPITHAETMANLCFVRDMVY